jgi:hypothetical protein
MRAQVLSALGDVLPCIADAPPAQPSAALDLIRSQMDGPGEGGLRVVFMDVRVVCENLEAPSGSQMDGPGELRVEGDVYGG